MPRFNVINSVNVDPSPRLLQVSGMYDVEYTSKSTVKLSGELPIESIDWQIGVICGPSGCGKTTIARKVFGDALVDFWDWPRDQSIVDAFPADMSVKDVVMTLTAVGFSSPPAWARPFYVLSNGEQFRANLARTIACMKPLVVIDEFTSVIDRTVAKSCSYALQKAVRRTSKKVVLVSCHEDILEWLEADWVYEPAANSFSRRRLRRPNMDITLRRATTKEWELFRGHHYLTGNIHAASKKFVAEWEERPIGFSSWLFFPHPCRAACGWREHRTVILPDYQGLGLGNWLSETVASLFRSVSANVRSTTGHPAMIGHRFKSAKWTIVAKNSRNSHGSKKTDCNKHLRTTASSNRHTMSFRYVGEKNLDIATKLIPELIKDNRQ